MRIGLLGGSFNPAHQGHRHVAMQALRALRLDQVWLLVSPGNPLKAEDGMAAFGDRLASARRIADGRRIVATGIEATLCTRFTIDTVRALRTRFPCARFVWIMGADILAQLPDWKRWEELARLIRIVVLPRPGYTYRGLSGVAAHRMRAARKRHPTCFANAGPPGWLFLPSAVHTASATAIRAAGQ